eukprot:gb/GEZN01008824.1/.p1 GENE.gb/GEZN01008824.1/~~gb/GEZN01008824.1/.p1  ORF type:complete len:413 (-),score=48.39 gb/GEZN01008824.1/:89-1327(-)
MNMFHRSIPWDGKTVWVYDRTQIQIISGSGPVTDALTDPAKLSVSVLERLGLNEDLVYPKYLQVYDRYPEMSSFYLDWEKQWHGFGLHSFMCKHIIILTAIPFLYLVLCFLGQRWMANSKPFGLKKALQLWNLGLSVFSVIGLSRTLPHLALRIWEDGVYFSVCANAASSYGLTGPSALWTTLFIFSKYPELIDTVFIVLRKKPLIFLHYYHHVTVLLFCLHAYICASSLGLYFATMNYLVHSIMYFYYFLTAYGYRPPYFMSMFVTVLQITQMFVGILLLLIVKLYWNIGLPCDMAVNSWNAGALMYASYFLLFFVFFVNRYWFKKKKKTEKKKTAEAPAEGERSGADQSHTLNGNSKTQEKPQKVEAAEMRNGPNQEEQEQEQQEQEQQEEQEEQPVARRRRSLRLAKHH